MKLIVEFTILVLLLDSCCGVRYIEADNTDESYQVLLFFTESTFPQVLFKMDMALLGTGCVLALEKAETKWNFNGAELKYKGIYQDFEYVSNSIGVIERELYTKKYPRQGVATSEVSLILGPIQFMAFVRPFCYANMYNCIFGIAKITSEDLSAISESWTNSYYQRAIDGGRTPPANNNLDLEQRENAEPIIEAMFGIFRWELQHVVIFADLLDSYNQASGVVLALQDRSINLNITEMTAKDAEKADEVFAQAVVTLTNVVPTKARVVLLFGSQRTVRDIMLQAYDAGMTENNEYVFIIIPTNYFPLYSWKGHDDALYFDMDQKERDEDARKAFQSAFIITTEIDTSLFDSFAEEVKERAKSHPFNYTFPADRELPLYAANYHDAVLLWSYAMNNHYDATTGNINVSALYNRAYTKSDFNDIEPISGTIELDEYGDRKNSFLFWHLNKTGDWEKVGRYADTVYTPLLTESEIAWPGGKKTAPLAVPECGFKGELCPDHSSRDIGIGVGVGAFVVLSLGLLIMTHMYRKAKYEAELASMSWKIPLKDLKDVGKGSLGSSVFGIRSRLTINRSSDESRSLSNFVPNKGHGPQYFSKKAQYKGKIVALKTTLPQYFTINRNLMIEMKVLKELRNENLLAVHGAVSEQDICYLVTEYCTKGSLQDILENEDVKLDDMLNFSLINDLCRGMEFLHASQIESHGYLKSSNCIINNHFSLKISDYSRSVFMSDMDRLSRATPEARNERLVYRAPELLRMQCIPCKGTKEGDMYSFGIIVHEILVREGPFGLSNMDCDLTATEVINMVVKTDIQTPFRPEFPFSADSKLARAISLAREAWSEDPTVRPTFRDLRSKMRNIRCDPNISGGIVENLLGRMEKYATNLEEVVEERTAQLTVEKKRTDNLLESMLPKSVADKLKSGYVVPPEWFDCVSIYFSDIVGFTKLSSKSKPIQVLDMLNDLYTVFDECIEKYDCYKVETIGDAYMVVSGLPIRNGDRHAAQIGLMSLDFLNCVSQFVVRHLPEEKLRIRIGMHSGPVVAGIVGTKMPRYCLFGDTVNTASRMESNGEALRIQMSEQSFNILNAHGGFIIKPRGLVEMKGKGSVPTFWLEGVEEDINVSNPRNFTDQALQKNNERRLIQEQADNPLISMSIENNNSTHSSILDKDTSNGSAHKISFPKFMNNSSKSKDNQKDPAVPPPAPAVLGTTHSTKNNNIPSYSVLAADQINR